MNGGKRDASCTRGNRVFALPAWKVLWAGLRMGRTAHVTQVPLWASSAVGPKRGERAFRSYGTVMGSMQRRSSFEGLLTKVLTG